MTTRLPEVKPKADLYPQRRTLRKMDLQLLAPLAILANVQIAMSAAVARPSMSMITTRYPSTQKRPRRPVFHLVSLHMFTYMEGEKL